MKKLFLIILCLFSATARAQNNSGILIILNNGDSIRSHYVGINNAHNLFRGPHVRLSPTDKDQRLSTRDIRSIEGYDQNTHKYRYFKTLEYPYQNTLAERAFKSDHIETYYFDAFYQSGPYGGGYNWRHLHYSKDGGTLKKAVYANLKKDLADRPEAMAYLKKANGLRIAQYIMYGAGAGLIVAAFGSIASMETGPGADTSGSDNALTFGIAGAFMLRIPFFFNNPKQKYMNQALEAY